MVITYLLAPQDPQIRALTEICLRQTLHRVWGEGFTGLTWGLGLLLGGGLGLLMVVLHLGMCLWATLGLNLREQ